MNRQRKLYAALASLAIIGGFFLLRSTTLTADLDASRLVGLSSAELIHRCGRPDMIVPRAERGEQDWLYNKGVMGKGRKVRIRNDRVVSVSIDREISPTATTHLMDVDAVINERK
jgi:hypothetical protein